MTRRGRVAVVTIVAGRHRHLRAHLAALARSARQPHLHVVVSMGDPEIARLVADGPVARLGVDVITRELEVPDDGELPLAAARNVGADEAIRLGCDLLVFLDVDCLVSRGALGRYERAWRRTRGRHRGPVLLSGPVSYLPPLPPGQNAYPTRRLASLARPHAARPAPRPGRLQRATDLRLFWSLSFAVAAQQWDDIGGFATGYRGYGGRTPTSPCGWRRSVACSTGSAARTRFTSTTRWRALLADTLSRSSGTPTTSVNGGAGSRWRDG